MKSAILTVVTLFLLPFSLIAQNTEDVVYLKDGGVIRGEIIERSDDGFLKIETVGRNVLVIEMDLVAEIKNEKSAAQYYKTTGYINRSGIDVLAGNSNSTRFTMINGYRFSPRFSSGVGISFVHYDDPISLIPVFLDFNFRLLRENSSPYLSLKMGYSFSMHTNEEMEINGHSGGFTFNPGMGVQFDLENGIGFFINMGYNVDNLEYEFDFFNIQTVKEELTFRRINIGLGLVF